MPEWIKWFFDGIGTQIISLVIGALIGGFIGFRAGKRKNKFSQRQTAGYNSEQYQNGNSINKLRPIKHIAPDRIHNSMDEYFRNYNR